MPFKETIELNVQASLFNEFGTIAEIGEALNVLKVVINYARTTSANSDESLGDFIKKIYVESTYKDMEIILKNNVSKLIYIKTIFYK